MELIRRFRRWALLGISLGALLYLALSLWAGLPAVASEVRSFTLALVVPVLLLSLVNYALRFAKWQFMLRRVGVKVKLLASAEIFTAGLAMTITPGKAGELLKPYLVRSETGAPVSLTVPALVAERATDAMALVALAGFGVTTHFSAGLRPLLIAAAILAAALGLVASERASLGLLSMARRLPIVARFHGRLVDAYKALRSCLSPGPLLVALLLSFGAWFAECVGYYLVLRGLHAPGDLSVATFLYAFSTVLGAPSPGGLGVADTALGEGAARLIPGITHPQAIASAILCRAATLWFGVALGAVALLRRGATLREVEQAPARAA